MNELIPHITHKQLLKIDKDYEKAASLVNLVYVHDIEPGINRIKKKTKYIYVYDEKEIKDTNELGRIQKLAIPPSWENVWICPMENGHLQATGLDLRKRKQYRYHSLWHILRNQTKYHRLYEFGTALPALRLSMEKDISGNVLNKEKVLATILSLMERTYIRVGNIEYEKSNGSYGLTTLKDRHAKIEKNTVTFSFKGKKGVYHSISLRNKKIAKIVKDCRDIPGKELFQYYDETGDRKVIDSGAVNQYIKEKTGQEFTAKDFRTWAGTLHALHAFRSVSVAGTDTEKKKNIVEVLDLVSEKLGNTRTVCKKYYVHPGLIQLYEEEKLQKYLKELDKIEKDDDQSGLTAEEKVLMKILKK
ncbi:MAG: DNA topoisomerase IB [Chitinophagaceae bacterium]